MPSYKLTYFDGRGRAELIRLMFVFNKVDFEDVRLTHEEWLEVKADTPFGQLPVLDIDGQRYAQSVALYNYVARETGMAGKDSLETLKVEQVFQLGLDFATNFYSRIFKKEEEKTEEDKKYLEEEVAKVLGYLTTLLKQSGTDYFVGSRVTLADLGAVEILSLVRGKVPEIFSNFPELQAHVERVTNDSRLKDYIQNRKETQF